MQRIGNLCDHSFRDNLWCNSPNRSFCCKGIENNKHFVLHCHRQIRVNRYGLLQCSNRSINKRVKKKVRGAKRMKKKIGHTVDNGNSKILYTNINGFKSKADSVNQIVVEQNIDILLIGLYEFCNSN